MNKSGNYLVRNLECSTKSSELDLSTARSMERFHEIRFNPWGDCFFSSAEIGVDGLDLGGWRSQDNGAENRQNLRALVVAQTREVKE